MNKENVRYYEYLEELRKSGVTNMFGATPYLSKAFNITTEKSRKILSEWMDNYDEISKELDWKR